MKKLLSILFCLGLAIGVVGCSDEERYTNEEAISILEDNGYTIGDDYIGGVQISTGNSDNGWFAGKYTSEGDIGYIFYYNNSINDGSYTVDSTMPDSTEEETKLNKKYSDELKNEMKKELKELDLDEKHIIEIIKNYFK